MNVDIVIVGAGPSGLCLARSLSGQGLTITIIEQQTLEAISEPAFDGREIALTQHSAKIMRELGLWQQIEPHSIHNYEMQKYWMGSLNLKCSSLINLANLENWDG